MFNVARCERVSRFSLSTTIILCSACLYQLGLWKVLVMCVSLSFPAYTFMQSMLTETSWLGLAHRGKSCLIPTTQSSQKVAMWGDTLHCLHMSQSFNWVRLLLVVVVQPKRNIYESRSSGPGGLRMHSCTYGNLFEEPRAWTGANKSEGCCT